MRKVTARHNAPRDSPARKCQCVKLALKAITNLISEKLFVSHVLKTRTVQGVRLSASAMQALPVMATTIVHNAPRVNTKVILGTMRAPVALLGSTPCQVKEQNCPLYV